MTTIMIILIVLVVVAIVAGWFTVGLRMERDFIYRQDVEEIQKARSKNNECLIKESLKIMGEIPRTQENLAVLRKAAVFEDKLVSNGFDIEIKFWS